jgi:hypothetical protein
MERHEGAQATDAGFDATKNRLQRAIDRLNRRGNVNLFLGIVVALTGLGSLSWFVTHLPGFASSTSYLASFAPRLSLVAFIGAFAYFFLRLYREALADIKEYETTLVHLELKQLATRVALTMNLAKSVEGLIATFTSPLAGNSASKGVATQNNKAYAETMTEAIKLLQKLVDSK